MSFRGGTASTQDMGAGIMMVLLTASLFARSNATIKHLGATIPVLVLMWTRYLFQTGTLAVWFRLRKGNFRVRSQVPGLQAVRGYLLLANSTASFYGVQHVPLAEFTALVLLAPVATTVLGAVMLKEQVTPARAPLVRSRC